MEDSKGRTWLALALALVGGYLLSVSADPARGVPDALLALVIGAALGLATLVMQLRGYVSGRYIASADELAYRPWRPIHFLTCGVRAGAGLSTVVDVPRINTGIGMLPCAAVAAISTAEKGVISTWPWPNPFSAF